MALLMIERLVLQSLNIKSSSLIDLKHTVSVWIQKHVMIFLLQVYCKTMCHGPEDPSQRAAESTAQRHLGEGLHCYNQGAACAFFVIVSVVFQLIAFVPG